MNVCTDCGGLDENDRGFELSSCCLGRPYARFYWICDASNGCRKLGFEFWQQMSVRGRRFVSWHIFENFDLWHSEQEVHYARKPDGWTHFETTGVLVVLTAVAYAYLMELRMVGTMHERLLIRRTAKA